jgi:hypothetical protein
VYSYDFNLAVSQRLALIWVNRSDWLRRSGPLDRANVSHHGVRIVAVEPNIGISSWPVSNPSRILRASFA